jgi:hypothetical protein
MVQATMRRCGLRSTERQANISLNECLLKQERPCRTGDRVYALKVYIRPSALILCTQNRITLWPILVMFQHSQRVGMPSTHPIE